MSPRAEVEAGPSNLWQADQQYYIGYDLMITNNATGLVIFQLMREDETVAPVDNIRMHLQFSDESLDLQVNAPGDQGNTMKTIASIPVSTGEEHQIALAFDTYMHDPEDTDSANNTLAFWLDGKKIIETSGLDLWSSETRTYPRFGLYRGEYEGPSDQNADGSRHVFDSYMYKVQISNSSLDEILGSSGVPPSMILKDDVQMTEKTICDGDPSPGESCWTTINSSNITREYKVHFPVLYDPSKATPLVFSFHGRGKSASEQELLSGFSHASNVAIAVYPEGKKKQWQGDPQATTNDIAFVLDMLADLTATYPAIDPTRIYATGKSNGGGLVGLLACDRAASAHIAAFAPVSAAFYDNNTAAPGFPAVALPPCDPANATRAVPVLDFHGLADCTIRYGGGLDASARGYTRAVPAWVAGWAAQRGCVDAPDVEGDVGGCGIVRESWTCRGVADAVVHYRIPGLQHDWPSRSSRNGDCPAKAGCAGGCTTCIDATPIIMKWLLGHSLDSEEQGGGGLGCEDQVVL
ncbi:hypothetical protein MBLNU459_g6211t2 [Dothideomycetes sp. NU459]